MSRTSEHRRGRTRGWRVRVTVLSAATISFGVVVATAGTVGAQTAPHAKSAHFRGAPIHFAMTNSYTGTYATFGAAGWAGATTAAYVINHAGGINGHQLILDKVDDVGDPVEAVPNVRQDIAVNHPLVMIGESSLTVFAVKPITDAAGIPDFIAAGSLSFDKNRDPLLWRITPSDGSLAGAMAIEAHLKGYKTGAILFQSGSPDNQLAPDLQKTFTHLGGKITSLQYFSVNQTSYLSEIQKTLAGKPQVIFLDAPATSAATIMNGFVQLNNLNDQFIGTDLTAGSDWTAAVTPAVAHAHLISIQAGANAAGPAVTSFLHYYAIANHVSAAQAVAGANAGANYVYDAVTEVALAMDHAHSSNPKVWNRQVQDVTNPPGTVVTNYVAGLRLLKQGKKINWTGAAGPDDYNQYHNEFGSYNGTQVSLDGTAVKTLNVITAAALKEAIK